MKSLTILLPALNEVEAIGKVIAEVPTEELQKLGYKVSILVADSGSTDGTIDIALEMNCFVLHGQKGKGNVVRYALKFLQEEDLVCMVDSDGTYPLSLLPKIISIYETDTLNIDIISGTRLEGLALKGAMTPLHKIGNLILTEIAKALYKKKTSDLCTGYWIFIKKAIKAMDLKAKSFDLEAEIFTQINKKKLNHIEVPIIYKPRIGTPPKLKFSHAIIIAWTLIKGKLTK